MPQPLDFTPKEPQNEVGRQARQQYLQFAQRIIYEPTMDYATLYRQFVPNEWATSSSTMPSPRCLRESLIVAKQKTDAAK